MTARGMDTALCIRAFGREKCSSRHQLRSPRPSQSDAARTHFESDDKLRSDALSNILLLCKRVCPRILDRGELQSQSHTTVALSQRQISGSSPREQQPLEIRTLNRTICLESENAYEGNKGFPEPWRSGSLLAAL